LPGWQVLDQFVSLGRLISVSTVADPDLVVETRSTPALPSSVALGIDAEPCRTGAAAMFVAVRTVIEPETRKIVPADAFLAPNAKLQIRRAALQFHREGMKWMCRLSSIVRTPPPMEAQPPAAPRRIWTRDWLTTYPTGLERQTWFESQRLLNQRRRPERTDLILIEDRPLVAADLSRTAHECFPTLPASRLVPERRQPVDSHQSPNLIGPRVKLRYDLQPLRRAVA